MTDVLVVDDDFDIRDTIREVLEDFGVSTATATNGREAITWLRANGAPRVILLDWMMPVCDGATFRAEQMADPALAPIPVILLTADAHIHERVAAIDPDAHLRKPVELNQLIAAVRRFLPG